MQPIMKKDNLNEREIINENMLIGLTQFRISGEVNFLSVALKSLYYSNERNLTISIKHMSPKIPKNIFEANPETVYNSSNILFEVEDENDIVKFIMYIFNCIDFDTIDIIVSAKKTFCIKVTQTKEKYTFSLKLSDFNYILKNITVLPIYNKNIVCTKIHYTIYDKNNTDLTVAFSQFDNLPVKHDPFTTIHSKLFDEQIKFNSGSLEVSLVNFSTGKTQNFTLSYV